MSTEKSLLQKKFLSGSTLKIIACICMFIDHTFHILMRTYRYYIPTLGYEAVDNFNKIYRVGRGIGRAAFPIYCFLLVEGFAHTRNVKKYLLRLLIMAVVSEHAFNLLYSGQHIDAEGQNVFFTLFISLLTIWCISKVRMREDIPPQLSSVLILIISAAGCLAAHLLKTDYSYHGVLSVTVIYLLNYDRLLDCLGGAISFAWEPWAVTSFVPIYFYNGRRGLHAKYFFYLFYPLHIYLIYYIITYVFPPAG